MAVKCLIWRVWVCDWKAPPYEPEHGWQWVKPCRWGKSKPRNKNKTKIPLPIESCPVSGAGAGWTMWVLDLGLGFKPCPTCPPGPIPGPPGIIIIIVGPPGIIIVSRPPWLPGLPIMPWGRWTWPICALGAGAYGPWIFTGVLPFPWVRDRGLG